MVRYMVVPKAEPLEIEAGDADAGDGRRAATPGLLLALTVSMFGIGYAWAVQFARVPALLEELGLSDDGVSVAFLAGPVAGLLVQPVVGALSDRTRSPMGRRRPWMAAALGGMVLAFGVLGEAYWLGGSRARAPGALATAVGAFWLLDFAQNAVQLPARTLVSDCLRAEDVAA
eukprot:CAMPEP_0119269612 /NCGR_PEP_ID=MMETSP1329-20130426/6955_1 /TAXON_ID=114041 /ORGANISM="Genus nov. species nov., Strain RCC1024" /LENGTH=172 /DNA_ID=CAMNT_0007269611 /DNA_START=146 /DNA_END=661 /DNA_ORIENTATION=-